MRAVALLVALASAACGPAVTHRSQILSVEGACRESFGQPYVKVCLFEDPGPRLRLELAAQNDKRLADPGSYRLELRRGDRLIATRDLPAVKLRAEGISCTSDGACQDWDFSATTELAVPEAGGWTNGAYRLRFLDRQGGRMIKEVAIQVVD